MVVYLCSRVYYIETFINEYTNTMARRIHPITLQCSYRLITIYKRGPRYFARMRSRLTRERVKTSPEFTKTMESASLLSRASKIASAIYSHLPKNWRQFWMYQSFTGEAMQMIKAGKTEQEAHDQLWNTIL